MNWLLRIGRHGVIAATGPRRRGDASNRPGTARRRSNLATLLPPRFFYTFFGQCQKGVLSGVFVRHPVVFCFLTAARNSRRYRVMKGAVDVSTSEVDAKEERISAEKRPRDPFSKVRPELSEDEFASPAVARLLLDRIADLQSQLRDEKPFRAQFHEADKERAVLQEKFKVRVSSEVTSGFCLSLGTLLVGLAPVVSIQPQILCTILLWIGIALIIGAILSRIIVLRK